MEKFLAIDYGAKKVGLAIGDTETRIASPFRILANTPTLLDELNIICQEENINKIVLGVPIGLKGIKSKQYEQVIVFSEKLSESEIWALTDFLRSLSFATVAGGEPTGTLVPVQNSQATAQTSAQTTPLANVLETEGAQTGSITGLVINGSGGALPSEKQVILHAFDQMQLVYTATTSLDADGTYIFENLDIPNGRSFLATIDHQGLIYSSEFVTAEGDQSSQELPIQVYDSIKDPSVLSVDRLHFFFEMLDKNTFRVVELYVISNPGNQTVVAAGQGQPVVRFFLPPQAGQLEFEDGELGNRYIKTEDGFGDTLPVYPGSGAYQVLFSYTMPYDKKLELSKKISMNTNAVVILVPEATIKVKGEGLEDGGTRDVQGTPYHMYNGGKFLQGEEIKLVVTGRPASLQTGFSLGSNQNLIVGFGALGLVLVIAGLWLYQRSRKVGAESQSEALPVPRLDETEESLMDAILALDDLYQEGKLPEDAYFERRGELKNRLKQLRETQG